MMKRVFKKLSDGRVIYTFESASIEAPEKAVMPKPEPKQTGGGRKTRKSAPKKAGD